MRPQFHSKQSANSQGTRGWDAAVLEYLKESSVEDQTSRKGETVETSDMFKSSYTRLSKLKSGKHKPDELKYRCLRLSE